LDSTSGTMMTLIFSGALFFISVIAHRKRWWLTFYLTASVAFMAAMIAFSILTGLDTVIMSTEAQTIAGTATFLGMKSVYLPPNAFIFRDPTGWSIFGIGFECSSLIEISVLIALLIFYPGYSRESKIRYAFIGATMTYMANLIRMLLIIYIVSVFGKSTIYLAHAIIGKLVFFLFVILLYWYLLTRPTVDMVRDMIKAGKFE
jgi:exosortase family protein